MVADTPVTFNNLTCAYLDIDFDGKDSLNFLPYFSESPSGSCCGLNLEAL